MATIFEEFKKLKEKEWFESKYEPELVIEGPLTEEKIRKISEIKNEPEWMLEKRLEGLKAFKSLPMPSFGPKLDINFDEITYFASPISYPKPKKWEELPQFIKEAFIKLGLSKEEAEMLAGVEFQFDSVPVFKKIKKRLEEYGVVFMSMDEAVNEYPEIVKKYFAKVISPYENKFAALNTAVWSGGAFIYVPKNVKLDFPLHAYFRINLEKIGQFERTLIIAEENSEVTYVEGCSAPIYSASSLHAAVVEVIAMKNSKVKYFTLQNWSKNVYNLVTKRAVVEDNAKVQWVSVELGSKATMLYPSLVLKNNAIGEIYNLSIAYEDQHIDSGGKLIFIGNNSKGMIVSKSIAIGKNAIATSRFDIKVTKNAKNSTIISKCDSLSIDNGRVETIPRIIVDNKDCYFNHEGKSEIIDEERLFYLKTKGLEENIAKRLIFFGFFEDVTKTLPDFFRLEVNKLLSIELEEYGGFG
ncbi:MAG: Fe-S cluster assembly protein SufB [Candidatus Aenigmatarchaeota archaeon]